MKQQLMDNIFNDLKRLEELNITNEIDQQILEGSMLQLKQWQEALHKTEDTSILGNIYTRLKLPINSLLST